MSGCGKVVGMIALAPIWEQERAHGKGVATVHAGTDAEETAGDEASGRRQPSQQDRCNSAGNFGRGSARWSKGSTA